MDAKNILNFERRSSVVLLLFLGFTPRNRKLPVERQSQGE